MREGFVDLQVNGFAGVDFRDATAAGYATAAAAMRRTGTAAFTPTLYGMAVEGYERALEVLAEVHAAPPEGATVLGAHLEGPFLNPAWAGAHDPTLLLPPDLATLQRLLQAGPVTTMTLAPELPGAGELIDALAEAGVLVAIGHTNASADEAHAAFDRGAAMLTHCHNAHRRFAPRDPGPAGAALSRDDVAVGLICDLVHLAPETVRLTFAAARGRVAVVTDAVAPAGPGTTSAARLPDGTLAGSLTPMDGALRNLAAIGVAPEDALEAVTTTPRRLLAGAIDRSVNPPR